MHPSDWVWLCKCWTCGMLCGTDCSGVGGSRAGPPVLLSSKHLRRFVLLILRLQTPGFLLCNAVHENKKVPRLFGKAQHVLQMREQIGQEMIAAFCQMQPAPAPGRDIGRVAWRFLLSHCVFRRETRHTILGQMICDSTAKSDADAPHSSVEWSPYSRQLNSNVVKIASKSSAY